MQLGAIAVFAAITVLTGCVTLTDKARRVQVHTQLSSVLDDCTKLGPVMAESGHMLESTRDSEVEVKLREAAADLGGDTVAVLSRDSTFGKDYLHGIAFKCYGVRSASGASPVVTGN